jgi:hypothetical protein
MRELKNGMSRKKQKEAIEAYLLECVIDSERLLQEYDITATTDRERVNYVMADFETVANHPHNIKRFPNDQQRFADYLQGAPGVINIDFWNDEIIKPAVKWGSLAENHTEKEAAKITENWFNYISF